MRCVSCNVELTQANSTDSEYCTACLNAIIADALADFNAGQTHPIDNLFSKIDEPDPDPTTLFKLTVTEDVSAIETEDRRIVFMGDGTEFLAALVVWVEAKRWYGYVVFDDMRLSPLHPHLAIPLLYELYPSESVETQLERARAHWLALCDVFRALMTPKGGNYGEATRPD